MVLCARQRWFGCRARLGEEASWGRAIHVRRKGERIGPIVFFLKKNLRTVHRQIIVGNELSA